MTKNFGLTVLFILLICPQVYAQQEIFPFIAEVTAQGVNVRAGGSQNFERLCGLEKGEEVVVLDRRYSWFKIQLPVKARIFISEKYVHSTKKDIGIVLGENVNVRAGAGVKFTVVGQLDIGERVKIIEKEGDWYRIEPIEKMDGWVADDYLLFKAKYIPSEEEINKADGIISEKKNTGVQTEEIEDQAGLIANSTQSISVVGVLKPERGQGDELFFYKIVTDEGKIYYLRRMKHLLDQFIDYKVELIGMVELQENASPRQSIIKVKKIQLVL